MIRGARCSCVYGCIRQEVTLHTNPDKIFWPGICTKSLSPWHGVVDRNTCVCCFQMAAVHVNMKVFCFWFIRMSGLKIHRMRIILENLLLTNMLKEDLRLIWNILFRYTCINRKFKHRYRKICIKKKKNLVKLTILHTLL